MLYKLLIYLKSGPRLFFIDQTVGELEALKQLALERKNNNADYIAIIGTYTINSAILM